jgi:hypothetical protein
MPESRHAEVIEVVERPVSIAHFVHTLRAYAPVIVLSTLAIGVLYIALAVAVYIFSPSQRITTQRFRLDFDGAVEGRYPNGLKFSTSDILSTPVLLKVFQENHLDKFTGFSTFSRVLFVLEANPEYERLAADYQSRLADPKLSAIDRERILREWQSKAAAVAKNEYSINWLRSADTARVPEDVVRKVLLDTLGGWAAFATHEQHVLKYRLSVLSPDVISATGTNGEPVVGLQVLRSKIYKVLQNIDDLRMVPGSELMRSRSGVSLEEIRLRLEEIVRFRVEPLAGRIGNGGPIGDRAATLRFLESQLAYDQRALKAAQDTADTVRQSLAVYSLDQRSFTPESAAGAAPQPREQARPAQPRADTVVPQVNDSFIDRLLTLTSQSADVQYRQKIVDDYRRAAQAIVPAQQAVSYDQEIVALIRNSTASGGGAQAAETNAEIVAMQTEVKHLLGEVNEIYKAISATLNPSKELYTLTAPVVTRMERSRSLKQLALYGVALMALSLPIVVALCLLHARIREEEATETFAATPEAGAAG